MNGCRQRKDGFTLLEVVISLALFAIAVSVLGAAYVNVLNSLDRLQVDQHFEQDMAMVREVTLMIGSVDELEKGGEIVTATHGVANWSAEYEETLIADLFKVSLLVEFPAGEDVEERVVSQEFYLTRPNWSEPSERDKLRADTRERFESQKIRRGRI